MRVARGLLLLLLSLLFLLLFWKLRLKYWNLGRVLFDDAEDVFSGRGRAGGRRRDRIV
jgi:hypothetical protein